MIDWSGFWFVSDVALLLCSHQPSGSSMAFSLIVMNGQFVALLPSMMIITTSAVTVNIVPAILLWCKKKYQYCVAGKRMRFVIFYSCFLCMLKAFKLWFSSQYFNIGPGNGLAPNRRIDITRSNIAQIYKPYGVTLLQRIIPTATF